MQLETASVFEQAEQEFEHGRFARSFDLYMQVMLAWMVASEPSHAAVESLTAREMVALERLADLSALFGQWDKASQILKLVKNLFEQAGNRYAADYIALKLVSLEINRGFIWQARQELQQLDCIAGRLSEIEFTERGFEQLERARLRSKVDVAERAVFFSRLYLEIGRLEAATGEYQRALVALKRGLSHSHSSDSQLARQAIIPLILAIARAELEQGDLQSTEVALQSLPASVGSLSPHVASLQQMEITGKVALLRGEFGLAKQQFERVLEFCEIAGFEQAAAQAKLNLAQVLIYLNHTREASELLESVRELSRACHDEALQIRAESLLRHAIERGQSLIETVPIAASVVNLWDAREEVRATEDQTEWASPFPGTIAGNYLAHFEDRALGFHWLLSRRDWPAARRYLDEINEVFKASDSLLIRVRLFVMGCMLDYYTADYEEAAKGLQATVPILQQMGLLPELWQVQRFLSWCLMRLGRRHEAERTSQTAETVLASLAASLSGADQAVFMLNKWTAGEEYIAGEIDRLTRLKASVVSSSWLRRPWLRWQLMKQLGALLDYVDRYKGMLAQREVRGQRANEGDDAKPTLWRRLLSHPRDRLTISLVALPDRVLVTRLGWMRLDFGVSSLTRIQLRELVRRWHVLSLKGDKASRLEAERLMQILDGRIQLDALLETLPASIRGLTFVPDDSLHGLPFAAIRRKDKYLVEDYALSISFEWSGRRAAETNAGTALVVAATNKAAEYPALPGARSELDNVRQWLTRQDVQVKILADSDADKSTLLKLLPQASLLHIACHGIFSPNRPDCSGLVLASGGEAQIVSIRELSMLPLTELKQAVLSACWSADSFILPGRWIISLPETLWRAGAQSIVGCLWEVEDGVAGPLMKQFYENLETMPRDEALRSAQLDCIGGQLKGCKLIDISDPIYWAGFVLYGNSDRLKLS